jgi:uncharacterized membrane protein (UPF0127 family)
MLKLKAIIDGIPIQLNKVETSDEYKEGARASGEGLEENEGYMFEYSTPMKLQFENTGVPYDLRVLYLFHMLEYAGDPQGVVMEYVDMNKDCARVACPSQGSYKIAIELRKDFCKKNKIGKGSIISLLMEE